MRLVNDDRVVFVQVRIVLYLGKQHAVGHHLDTGLGYCLVREAYLATDFPAPGRIEFLGDAAGDRKRRDAPGLRARDSSVHAPSRLKAYLGQLRRLARTRLPRHDHDGMVAHRFREYRLFW